MKLEQSNSSQLEKQAISQYIKKAYERRELQLEKKSRLSAVKYRTKNGLTIQKLKAKGHEVHVRHLRWASKSSDRVEYMVPSYLRGHYGFNPLGGVSIVTVKTLLHGEFSYAAQCRADEGFDYRLGIKYALDKIPQQIVEKLLL